MTKPINSDIGYIPRAKLAALLPDNVPIRRGKNGKLYTIAHCGAWYWNTPQGQDDLLNHGVIYGPEGAPVIAANDAIHGAVPVLEPAPEPAPDPDPERGAKSAGVREEGNGSFLDFLGRFD